MAHTHEYETDKRPGAPGYVCKLCGLYIPESMEAAARNAGAIFIDQKAPHKMSHTPTPWRIGKEGGVVSDSAEGLESIPGAHDKGAYDYYGGYLIAESVTRENAAFIVEACNAHPRPSVLFLAQRETIDRLNRENEDLRRTLDIIYKERDGLLTQAILKARETQKLKIKRDALLKAARHIKKEACEIDPGDLVGRAIIIEVEDLDVVDKAIALCEGGVE